MKRLGLIVTAAALLCQAVWLLQAADAQDKGKKDKPIPTAAKPTLAPGPGEPKKAITVAIKCGTPDAVIQYTLDGGNPRPEEGTV